MSRLCLTTSLKVLEMKKKDVRKQTENQPSPEERRWFVQEAD